MKNNYIEKLNDSQRKFEEIFSSKEFKRDVNDKIKLNTSPVQEKEFAQKNFDKDILIRSLKLRINTKLKEAKKELGELYEHN